LSEIRTIWISWSTEKDETSQKGWELIISHSIKDEGRSAMILPFFPVIARISPMCKVKILRCPWYSVSLRIQASLLFVVPVQVGPQVSNPGYSTRADKLANVVADEKALTDINRHTLIRFFHLSWAKLPSPERMPVYPATFFSCAVIECGQWPQ
jgi:hypothetical protein